jgi:thiamine kinase-like enzyme
MSEPPPGVRERLARLPPFAGRPLDDLAIVPLAGLTNRSFRIEDGNAAYVLRLPGRGSADYVDRHAEARNAAIAARIGVAPELVAAAADDGVLLTRFLPGATPLDAAALRDPARLGAAARLLARLHGSGATFAGERVYSATLTLYRRLAAEHGADEAPALAAACAAAAPLVRALAAAGAPLAPCHIDPTPANFLAVPEPGGGERLYLIDWEYASMADPAWDLANLAGEAGLDAGERSALIAGHGATADGGLAARVALYLPLLHLLAAAWAALQEACGNPQADFGALARDRLALYESERRARAVGAALQRLPAG